MSDFKYETKTNTYALTGLSVADLHTVLCALGREAEAEDRTTDQAQSMNDRTQSVRRRGRIAGLRNAAFFAIEDHEARMVG